MQPLRNEVLTWDDVDKLVDHLLPQFDEEFEAMVESIGFRVVSLHGDYAGSGFSETSPFMIWTLQKRKGGVVRNTEGMAKSHDERTYVIRPSS